MEKVTAVASPTRHSRSGCGRPHNAHPTAKINKVEDLALDISQKPKIYVVFFSQCK